MNSDRLRGVFVRTFCEVRFIRSGQFHALCGNGNLLGQDGEFWA